MKNLSKNKFLTCFRPVVDIDTMHHESRAAVDRSSSRRFSCIPVADKHEKKNSETKSMFPEQGCKKFTENWAVPQPPKRRLVKVIKAMVVETILNGSARARHKNRHSHDCFGSKRNYYSETESSSASDEKTSMKIYKDSNIKDIKATELSMSSSSSSSTVSESKTISKHDKTKDQLEKQNKFKCFGIYLALIISLAVTVLWGKYYGVIFTSIWLCFLSLCNKCYGQLKEDAKLRNTDTVSKGYMNRDHNGSTGPKELSSGQ